MYRKQKLLNQLEDVSIKELLSKYGYRDCKTISDYLNALRIRLEDKEFPHEIGAFLGYPVQDIYGFIYHKDEGCLLVGEWRVYSNKENAKIMFLRFKRCRKALLKRVMDGNSLADIFCVA